MDMGIVWSGINSAMSVWTFRGKEKRKFFDEVIDPLYNALTVPLKDYSKLWGELRAQAEDATSGQIIDPEAQRKLRNALTTRREDMSVERRQVGGLAQRLAEMPEAEIQSFGRNIIELFGFEGGSNSPVTSDFGRLVDDLTRSPSANYQAQIGHSLNRIVELQTRFKTVMARINKEYAHLKVAAAQ
ncbi:hypothetical protein [Paraburkholderia humisilvae]|uniref:Uncharacterized protein n=1 Tax=Paraburkholderia humisilvae TaxID=627669 RepID=A0A6J5CXG7_9BURK|nr:hypothetical protein [Paraburkholderia humisilvae]CAB3745857.1 hypothetical protein LMG29542_00061 [Paraburkholderia humisilvae]